MRSNASAAAGIPAEIRIPEVDAQAVLLVRAVEEEDTEGELLSQAERTRARADELATSGFEPFLVERAHALREIACRKAPALARLGNVSRLRLTTTWIVVPALALGLASNLLGPEKHINVVANPLAGLILWNVTIYVLLAVGLVRRREPEADGQVAGPGAGVVRWLVGWRTRALKRRAEAGRESEVARAGASYLQRWSACALPLLGARLRHALHLGATAMVVGALVGMYARGLLFEYLATWESTFLGAEQLQAVLELVLGPASAVSGIEVPAVAAIQAPAADNAAAWIHLYALTTAWLVIVPRILLALGARRQAGRLAAALTLDTRPRYYRRVFASGHGRDLDVVVQPYSYSLNPSRTDALKVILHDVLGARAGIEVAVGVDYGGGFAPLAKGDAAEKHATILLFNLAQTPETEVHGRLLGELKLAVQEGDTCLVLVDSSAWRARIGEASFSERRLEERRRTWDRVVRDAGLSPVHLDLDAPPDADLLDRIERSFWPASDEEDVGVAS